MKYLDRNSVKEIALNSGFSLKDNSKGFPDLKEYVYVFAENIQKLTYSVIPFGLGKIGLCTGLESKEVLKVFIHDVLHPTLAGEEAVGKEYDTPKKLNPLPPENTLVCLNFVNLKGLDNLIEYLTEQREFFKEEKDND